MAALEALSIVDKVVLDRNGILSVRLQKMRMLGETALGMQYHSFAVMPGEDPELYFREVGAHLLEMGEASPDEAGSWSKVRRWVSQFHTTDEVERYRDRRRRGQLREDPDAAREGEIVFHLMGALYQTPASPKGRIDRVIAANPVLLARGRPEGIPVGKISIAPGESIDSEKTVEGFRARSNLPPARHQGMNALLSTAIGTEIRDAELQRINAAITCEHGTDGRST